MPERRKGVRLVAWAKIEDIHGPVSQTDETGTLAIRDIWEIYFPNAGTARQIKKRLKKHPLHVKVTQENLYEDK